MHPFEVGARSGMSKQASIMGGLRAIGAAVKAAPGAAASGAKNLVYGKPIVKSVQGGAPLRAGQLAPQAKALNVKTKDLESSIGSMGREQHMAINEAQRTGRMSAEQAHQIRRSHASAMREAAEDKTKAQLSAAFKPKKTIGEHLAPLRRATTVGAVGLPLGATIAGASGSSQPAMDPYAAQY